MSAPLPRLMLVTDRHVTAGRDLFSCIRQAADAGLELVQIREKDLPDKEVEALVAKLQTRCPKLHILVNNRPAVARQCGTGLHLPAEKISGDRPEGFSLVGCSVHNAEEIQRALAITADYLILGTIFATPSKPDVSPAGVAFIREIHAISADVPIFTIGGVTHTNLPKVRSAGAHGAAVCRAILAQKDIAAATTQLLSRLTSGRR